MRDGIDLHRPPAVSQEELDAGMKVQDSLACGPAGSLPRGSRLSRRGDPEPSHEAAAKVEPELRKSQAWLLGQINAWNGYWPKSEIDFTDKELQNFLTGATKPFPVGLRTGSGIRTRRHELAEAGHLELVRDAQGAIVKRQGCRCWKLKNAPQKPAEGRDGADE